MAAARSLKSPAADSFFLFFLVVFFVDVPLLFFFLDSFFRQVSYLPYRTVSRPSSSARSIISEKRAESSASSLNKT